LVHGQNDQIIPEDFLVKKDEDKTLKVVKNNIEQVLVSGGQTGVEVVKPYLPSGHLLDDGVNPGSAPKMEKGKFGTILAGIVDDMTKEIAAKKDL